MWVTFRVKDEDSWASDFIGAYSSKDMAMQPVRTYLRTKYPDLNDSDLEILILNNITSIKKFDSVEHDIYRLKFEHTNSQRSIFDIMSVKV